jgi:hypothetical protein
MTNLPHCSSNVAIRHNDATRRCDGDVTLRRDFALSRHNRQHCVAVTLFKLIHGTSLFVCSEMFTIGKSTYSAILRQIVRAINDCFRHEINWPTGERLQEVQRDFQQLCGLPTVAGAIDGTHINISKPRYGVEDLLLFQVWGI